MRKGKPTGYIISPLLARNFPPLSQPF